MTPQPPDRFARYTEFLREHSTEFTAGTLLVISVIATIASGSLRAQTRSDWLIATAIAAGAGSVFAILRKQLRAWTGVTDEPSEAAVPTRLIALVVFAGLIATWTYAAVDPQGSMKTAAALTLALAASLTSGSIGGFLFALPRFAYGTDSKYKPSTNLDEIADWLTKIIVGVGLIELKAIGPRLQQLAAYAAPACPNHCHDAPTAAVIAYGLACGFLFTYIWARLRYGSLAANADVRIIGGLKGIEAKAQESLKQVSPGMGKPSGTVPVAGTETTEAVEHEGGLLGPGVASREEVLETDPDDQNKGRFGGKANVGERVLRAEVTPSVTLRGFYNIRLTVSSTNPARPLTGAVIFHLHQTFSPSQIQRDPVNGVAELVVVGWGAFTVGAEIKSENIRLELDLSKHPEAPAEFKAR